MHPQLLVSDLRRSIDFYTGKLGFSLDFVYGDFYAGISREGHGIHLKAAETSRAERDSRRKNEHLDICFGVEGIAEIYGEIQKRNIETIQELRTMPYGREFYISDPDGYILGFVESMQA